MGEVGRKPHFIYLSPQGKVLTQNRVRELAEYENLALLCGHYEGVDERVIEELVDEEISIGDYVLTGGELPALVLVDAVCRMLPGVLANDEAFQEESHFHSLWNTRNIPDPMNGTEKRCPMCYSPAPCQHHALAQGACARAHLLPAARLIGKGGARSK